MKATVTNIEWEADGEEVDLPVCATVEVYDDADDDEIVDALSDKYGWLIKGVGDIKKEKQ